MTDEDYPALYQAADDTSRYAQKVYLSLTAAYLILLVLGATFTIYADRSATSGIIAAIFFLSTISLSILQASRRFDKTWYNGRAVAESVKTRTWRFMMRAEPYEDADSVAVVSNLFCSDLHEILRQNRSLAEYLGGSISTKEPISTKMLSVRSLSVPERLSLYQQERIDEQRGWYARKYVYNRKMEKIWFAVMLCMNTIALILLLIQIAQPTLDTLPVEAIIVAAGAALTWTQVKRFQEHSAAYSLTAHEIGIVRQQSAFVNNERQLSDFVKDAENAFSREHTQWVARRDV